MRRILSMVCGAVLLTALVSVATALPKPEQSISYRQSVFSLIGWNFGPMAGMVRGTAPFDAAQFTLRAERLVALSKMPLEGFPKGSERGSGTEALPLIWSNWKDFEQKLTALQMESQKLLEVSKGGNEALIKAQFGKTAGTCKACHDKYKKD